MTASLWSDQDAAHVVETWGATWGKEFVELVYASRLLGADPTLVSHGGGNSSIKQQEELPGGLAVETLRVKGSGINLSEILPEEFTRLDLTRVRALRSLETVEDTTLVEVLRAARLDCEAPFPSVEACLHAFIPEAVVLHTHAEAALLLGNQPEGARLLEDALGDRFAVVEYVPPGLGLARAVAAACEAHRQRTLDPDQSILGVVVRHHGVFTWAADAKRAYERMIIVVEACSAKTRELMLSKATTSPAEPHPAPAPALDDAALRERAARLAPHLRGALASRSSDPDRPWRRMVLSFRSSEEIRWLLAQPGAEELSQRGVMTPDHTLFARNTPLYLEEPSEDEAGETAAAAVAAYATSHAAYVERHRAGRELFVTDHLPRVVIVPSLGIFGAGRTRAQARAATEIAERNLVVRCQGEAAGRYEPASEAQVFALEFWPPEQAKLLRQIPAPLEGRVAMITGGAGAIGLGLGIALAKAGATVVLADRHDPDGGRERLDDAAQRVREAAGYDRAVAVPFDVTDPEAVAGAFRDAALLTGGVDLLVLSQGLAEVARIDALDPARLQTVFSVNTLGSFHVLGEFVRGARAQGTGGDVVLISTKNVPDPGASFSAYSASKAAAHQLARVAALELAADDIRVNMVSPDAVFGDEANPSLLWQEVGNKRARSRGLDPAELPEYYRGRNLLKTRVTASHVAEAVLFFVERRTPTTGAVLPVDGGLPGAFPR